MCGTAFVGAYGQASPRPISQAGSLEQADAFTSLECGRDADVWLWLLRVDADEWMCSARFVGASFSTALGTANLSSRLVGASRRRVKASISVEGMLMCGCGC